MTSKERKTVAAFDFDGTLTHRDTLIPFLARAAGMAGLCRALVASSPALARYAFGRMSNEAAKERLIACALQGQKAEPLRAMAVEWAPSIRLREKTLERLRWHQQSGHICVLVSASVDIYIEQAAKQLGFDAVACTRLEINEDGYLTGRFATPNCWGDQKVIRLRDLLGPLEQIELYAYGDSSGDLPMLKAASHAWMNGVPLNQTR